ncbi:MAG: hypothetical protein ABEH64_10780 [Salinirussus sp.]
MPKDETVGELSMNDDPETTSKEQRDDYLEIDDGIGCVEVWEHLSERRMAD